MSATPVSATSLTVVKNSQLAIRTLERTLRKLPMSPAQRDALPTISKTLLTAAQQYHLTPADAEDIGTALIEAEMVNAGQVVKYLAHHTPMEVCCALNIRAETSTMEAGGAVSLPVIFHAMKDARFPTDGDPTTLDYEAVYHEIERRQYTFSTIYRTVQEDFADGQKTTKVVLKRAVIHAHASDLMRR
jgi:hypothetical protein